MTDIQKNKALITRFYAELDAADMDGIGEVLGRYMSEDTHFRGMQPIGEQRGPDNVAAQFWQPLRRAIKPMQRRQDIFMAGTSEIDGGQWVMSMGHIMGLFDDAWLGIRPTGKMAFLRYADFNRIENGRITETGLFCDIIGVMHQAGLTPLPVETGAEIIVPPPRTHDGLLYAAQDPADAQATLELVNLMKEDLIGSYGTRVPPELLQRTWHDDMLWYGPSGIGSTYTIPRYQAQHQYPFREGLADITFNGHVCRFAEGNYAAWFGWPSLSMTPAGGFLGMPATDRRVDMRVVDIYRRDGDKLAENWVLIDLLHYLKQQGLDILERTASVGRGRIDA